MNEKILVVDDDPMIHKILGHSLKEEFHEITSKQSGEDAKEYLKENFGETSAVVLDWEMPGMNGLELLKWLKEDDLYKDIPVVMLTGHTDKEDIQIGINAGAYYYLTKPFNKDVLKSILRVAINDHLYLKQLNNLVREAQNPFKNMMEASFRIKTLEEAQKLSVYVANASAAPEETLIICELFNNAIEHGNLGITYEEKSELIDQDQLNQEIAARLAHPDYSHKFALIEFHRHDGFITIVVEDQGKGFDFKKYLKFDEARVFDNHGRGIAMANTLLDIKYLGKGNRVEVNIPKAQ